MQKLSNDTSNDLGETVGQVHKFGSASESLFRRIYRGLHRRSELDDALRDQSRLLHTQTQRNAALLRLQDQQQRALRTWASELERLHAVLGSMNEGIIVQDLDGKVTMMNRAPQTMLGGKRAFRDGELGAQYNRNGGFVAISSTAGSIAGKAYTIIRVSDNGRGISTVDLPRIFERFYRGEAATSDGETMPAGLGQGLYVARGICEAHGGFIQAQSRWNNGSTFTMGLPLML